MKIKVIDQHEQDKSIAYFKGFNTGVYNTLASLVQARESGLGLQNLYKTILSNYKVYRKRLEDENINH